MLTARAKVLKGGRIVLPREVRDYLGVKAGDTLCFKFCVDGVRIQRLPLSDPFMTFHEWSSAADDQAYREL
jgi:AbrB family looped-hinge helix DNA binding protein